MRMHATPCLNDGSYSPQVKDETTLAARDRSTGIRSDRWEDGILFPQFLGQRISC